MNKKYLFDDRYSWVTSNIIVALNDKDVTVEENVDQIAPLIICA
jgi:phage-related protein